MASKHMKRCSTAKLLGGCELKHPWDSTAHLLARPKSGTLTTPSADQDVEQQELSFTAGRNANGAATSEVSVVLSHKINTLLLTKRIYPSHGIQQL